jgi:hypothetical protein
MAKNRAERRRKQFSGDTQATIAKREDARQVGFSKPQQLSGLDIAFPATVRHLMPAMADIPKEFHRGNTDWNRLQSKWFFQGIDARIFQAKPGIDRNHAMGHLQAIQGSFEPKHEHKEAAVAYLMSLWFEHTKYIQDAAK